MDQITPQTAEIVRRFWIRVFSTGIENARKDAGLSIEDAAGLAGMKISQWMALETGGWLPQTTGELGAIAGTLEMDYGRLASWVLLCWSAWEE
jgi:transcriptional regulator with XRE-family HTH domain